MLRLDKLHHKTHDEIDYIIRQKMGVVFDGYQSEIISYIISGKLELWDVKDRGYLVLHIEDNKEDNKRYLVIDGIEGRGMYNFDGFCSIETLAFMEHCDYVLCTALKPSISRVLKRFGYLNDGRIDKNGRAIHTKYIAAGRV